MLKLYDTAFKIGFCANALIFVILNAVSYWVGRLKYKNSPIHFTPDLGFGWGFPFEMTRYETFSLNILIIAVCGFIVGLFFRFVWSKFRKSNLNSQG